MNRAEAIPEAGEFGSGLKESEIREFRLSRAKATTITGFVHNEMPPISQPVRIADKVHVESCFCRSLTTIKGRTRAK
jgi:hypothetical protein